MQWSNNNLIKKKAKEEKSCVSQPIHLFLRCLVIGLTQFLDRLNGLTSILFVGPVGPPLLYVPMRINHIHGVKILFQTDLAGLLRYLGAQDLQSMKLLVNWTAYN